MENNKEFIVIVTPVPKVTFTVKETNAEKMLRDLQDAVDGYIEIVRPFGISCDHLVMVVNDEGLIRGLPANPIGSLIYGDTIAGTIVIMKEGIRDGEPDLIGLTKEESDFVLRIFGGANNAKGI